MRNINMLAIIIFLSGCTTMNTIMPPPQKIMIVGDTLVYDGFMTGDAILEAIRLVRLSENKITTLRITSPGGDMASGIEFGYFIKEKNLNVVVSQLCFSACANYVLPAANSIVIKKDALIGWHGGAKQADELWKQSVPIKYQKDFFAYLNRLRLKEMAFFNEMNVDINIANYGQIKSNSCQKTQKADGWYYTLSDLKYMGIKNIKVNGGELLTEFQYNDNKITSCQMSVLFSN